MEMKSKIEIGDLVTIAKHIQKIEMYGYGIVVDLTQEWNKSRVAVATVCFQRRASTSGLESIATAFLERVNES